MEGYIIAVETEIDKWWEYTKQERGIRGRVESCYNISGRDGGGGN